MKKFFTKEEVKSTQITKTPQSCASCGLYKKAKNGRLKPWGKFQKKILIIAEAPTKRDDRKNQPFSDSLGDYIKWAFKENGIHLFKDCLITYACRCPIPKDAKPEDNEIFCCRKKVIKTIKENKPKIIFLVGAAAVKSIIGNSWKKSLGGIDKWRGFNIPDREYLSWINPIFSAKYVERKEDRQGRNLAEIIWLQDIKNGLKNLDKKIVFEDEKKYITHVKSDKHFKEISYKLLKAEQFCFDYEATGLKPHMKGHKLITTSAAISLKECYSWMNNTYRNNLFRKILESNVPKIAHNLAFENMWSFVKLNAKVNNWYWDTMINAHIIDNRPGITSLKFQTYVNFGVSDYDSLINPYLSSGDENGANSINQIEKFIKIYGNDPVREYCGLDSLYGLGLFFIQKEIIKGDLWL